MSQEDLFKVVPKTRFDLIKKGEVVYLFQEAEHTIRKLQKEIKDLRNLHGELKQKTFLVDEQYILLKNKLFGKSSEKESPDNKKDSSHPASFQNSTSDKDEKRKKRIQLPSERYPNAPVVEQEVELQEPPKCTCCGAEMKDSGLTEASEYLTVVPAKYLIIRQKRHKYNCGRCHGSLKTASTPPRIKPKSSYSDEMMLDVSLTKYCDLIPIERYGAIAGRAGLEGLPPQSLIELTHHVADFTKGAYDKLKEEIQSSQVLHADETPHKMLERNGGKSWYLWGFSNTKTSYFEIHNTRSGDVSSKMIKNSKCEYLVSDVFSGYSKTVREVNQYRKDRENKEEFKKLYNVYCNAHARRKFREAVVANLNKEPDPSQCAQYFVNIYGKIYRLAKIAKNGEQGCDKFLRAQRLMLCLFEKMKVRAMEDMGGYSSKSSMGKAMGYLLRNYKGLTLFAHHHGLPIDNNCQERQLRSPVVGRKTWYGTHSKRGAETASILFSLVESCKLNQVNPREYFKKLVQDIHQGKNPYTPSQYKILYPPNENKDDLLHM